MKLTKVYSRTKNIVHRKMKKLSVERKTEDKKDNNGPRQYSRRWNQNPGIKYRDRQQKQKRFIAGVLDQGQSFGNSPEFIVYYYLIKCEGGREMQTFTTTKSINNLKKLIFRSVLRSQSNIWDEFFSF